MLKNLLLSTLLSLRAHKLRVFLTMVGIIIGIAAVVTVSAIGEGMKRSSLKMLDSTNSNVVRLIYKTNVEGEESNSNPYDTFAFSRDDLKRLRELKHIDSISADYGYGFGSLETISANLSYFDTESGGEVMSNSGDNLVAYGRDFLEEDMNQNTIILTYDTLKYALGMTRPKDILGHAIDVDGEKFLVIGVKKEIGEDEMINDNSVFYNVIPKKAYNQLAKNKPINAIKLKIGADVDRNALIAEANERLIEYHPELDGSFQEDRTSESIRKQIEDMIQQVIIGLVFITAISLLVGGIGVMNIMYVSVSERKREIGIRRAIGAKPLNIMIQFLLEAAFITLLGGILGILLGWGIAQLVSMVAGIEAILSLKMTLISAGVSIAIGLVFGVIPAFNAARMDPIKAIYQ
ncbi:FtsX-like permease family protein [uncultured Vagococcus sp.]|uniref:ABC transporter permease n=1 Tax=uncultured Vagococcus sp. TaxID=189676 RepID=UPI0028D7C679|nr:FtsX-like permease family protein [uncultured Vagococcus sp.]